MKQAICIFVCLVFLSGCGGGAHYPKTWPKAVSTQKGDCPEISGEYYDLGAIDSDRYGGPDPGREKLSYWLTDSMRGGTKVKINLLSSDAVDVEVFSDNQSVEKKTLLRKNNQFSCSQGSLWLPKRVHNQGWFACPECWTYSTETRTFGFKRADDGSLIGREKLSFFGIAFFVIPCFNQSTDYWIQWEKDLN